MKIETKNEYVGKNYARIDLILSDFPFEKPVEFNIECRSINSVHVKFVGNEQKQMSNLYFKGKSYEFEPFYRRYEYLPFTDSNLKNFKKYGFEEEVLPVVKKEIQKLKLKMRILRNKKYLKDWIKENFKSK